MNESGNVGVLLVANQLMKACQKIAGKLDSQEQRWRCKWYERAETEMVFHRAHKNPNTFLGTEQMSKPVVGVHIKSLNCLTATNLPNFRRKVLTASWLIN